MNQSSGLQSAALMFGELVGQPVQPLVQTSTLSGTGGLNVPLRRQDTRSDTSCRQLTGASHLETSTNNTVPNASTCSYSSTSQAVQTQFVSQFAHSHCVWKILFVSKHQNNGVFQLVLLDLMTPWTRRVMRLMTERSTAGL